MFKKSDFKRLEVLGSGKKNTKIYKAMHVSTAKLYVLKEIEAKNLDKLNEYKEEAVQLMKVQNHPNVIKFYGYYFSETKFNSFKLSIITEFMDGKTNLEYIYRRRKKINQYWTEEELVNTYCSIISTCAFLQSKGICHRDIKPANIFLLPNNDVKLIDFGESKDYFYDPNDEQRETFTMATIRGTPQYLSPILWKAHVIDGNSRFAEHNIYKSDVFSAGLVLLQLALMNEVTGFNSKTLEVSGEMLLKESFKMLEKLYSVDFAQLFSLLLRFEESDRPSFCEIEALFCEKEQKCRENGKPFNEYIRFYNRNYSTIVKMPESSATVSLKSTFPVQQLQQQPFQSPQPPQTQQLPQQLQLLQPATTVDNEHPKDCTKYVNEEQLETRPPKNNYYKDSTMMLHESCYWFEFGGSSIGRFSIDRQKWKIDPGNEQKKFAYHFSVLFIPVSNCYFLLGGQEGDNFKIFQLNKKLMNNKVPMPTFRNFFSSTYHNQKVFVFGGYDGNIKTQLKSSEQYDIVTGRWTTIADLKIPRSQSASCRINDDEILICGGYNKDQGTLDSIERYIISKDRIEPIVLKLPIPLRRFMIVRVAKNKALILGGLTKSSKESQRVFKLNYEEFMFNELENLEKGGVIENEILVDHDGSLHIFLEHSSGTSPHSHIKYPYDPTKEEFYETKQI